MQHLIMNNGKLHTCSTYPMLFRVLESAAHFHHFHHSHPGE
ncbi:MAG: hypothetical protein AVDCRST_MAG95-1345 [uncultured Adhaeribacter sp.]|uniref:Uncharacterized protein n=1 Tax=uncultured Adhaeribacter sp. TaxID=448109 RepID=A0A6J4I160_9BACT|nr:MAG: hypothetical protein AVDCRST_MAG95-1345 [uncultured Adhaeribacter sp.]